LKYFYTFTFKIVSVLLLLTQLGGHQAIELRVAWKLVGKGYQGAAHLDKAVFCIHVGDVGKLKVGNVQKLGKLNPVGAGLVEHNDKLRVCQHSAGCMALQEIVHILRDTGTKSAILSDTLPERKQEAGTVFMLEQEIDLINDDKGVFAFSPVLCDAV